MIYNRKFTSNSYSFMYFFATKTLFLLMAFSIKANIDSTSHFLKILLKLYFSSNGNSFILFFKLLMKNDLLTIIHYL